MGYITIMHLEIRITYNCNWNCDYCAVDTHSQNKVDIDELYRICNTYKNATNITISGGEPGLVNIDCIMNILKIFKNAKKELNTNGLFLERYNKFIQLFDCINYHCSEDLDPIQIKKYNHNNIHYLLIITDDNIHKLERFLVLNKLIKFDIIGSTNPGDINEIPILSNSRILLKYSSSMTKQSQVKIFEEFIERKIIYI